MQETSDLYKELLADNRTITEVKAIIDGWEYLVDRLVSVSISGGVFGDDILSVGGTRSREIDIVLRDADNISRMAKMEMYVRLAKIINNPSFRYTTRFFSYLASNVPATAGGARVTRYKTARIDGENIILSDLTTFWINDPITKEDINKIIGTYQSNSDGSVTVIPEDSQIYWWNSDLNHRTLTAGTQLVDLDKTEYSEWIPKGVFYIDTRSTDPQTGVVSIHGYDAMLKAEQKFITSEEQGEWPKSDIEVVEEIADRIGVCAYNEPHLAMDDSTAFVYLGDSITADIEESIEITVYTRAKAIDHQIALSGDIDVSLSTYNLNSTKYWYKEIEKISGKYYAFDGEVYYIPTETEIQRENDYRDGQSFYKIYCLMNPVSVEGDMSKLTTGIDPRTSALLTQNFQVQYPGYGDEGYTVREVLGFIGSMYGGNWVISDKNELYLSEIKYNLVPAIANNLKSLSHKASIFKEPLNLDEMDVEEIRRIFGKPNYSVIIENGGDESG